LPPEPGRLVVCALVGRARRARGCSTPGDDRLETRVYAVKRYAYRLGHAARSARFATSIEQLVVGLAPVMGWGQVPRAGAARVRFVRAHRRSVQRWLDDLQAAGLVAHEPEKDGAGVWWRTQLVLHHAPAPADDELPRARLRARGWDARERRRRRSTRLTEIRDRSAIPSGLLTHPFGELSTAQLPIKDETAVDRTGAHVRGLPRPLSPPANVSGCTEDIARLSPDDFDAFVAQLARCSCSTGLDASPFLCDDSRSRGHRMACRPCVRRPPRVGGRLAHRQLDAEPQILALSWKAQRRLHHVWTRTEQRHKRRTIIAVAAARELAGFCWAVATAD
jgi:hypothetical protein